MIEYSFNVIDLFIFVIYDAQYVVTAHGFKINWIFIFANHKWATHVLNALVFVFLRVCLKTMCSFVNLLLKFNIFLFSLGFKEFKNKKKIYFYFSFKSFKDWNIYFACVWKYCSENG
jgi:hypothetical protein